jgi:hypothetical protein
MFSLVPKIPITPPEKMVERFEDKQTLSNIKVNKVLDNKVKFSSDLAAFNSSKYQDNLIEIKPEQPGNILPLGFDLSPPSNNNYDMNFKRTVATCNDKNLSQWKSNPTVARPWYAECSRGLCYNFNSNTFDDVAPNDMGFVATI